MLVKDPKVLSKLMTIEGVSQRELAAAAGWRSHSYLGRLLRGDARSLEQEPARRIARRLGVTGQRSVPVLTLGAACECSEAPVEERRVVSIDRCQSATKAWGSPG